MRKRNLAITNELIAFRDKHNLSRLTIARLTGASIHSVHAWFNPVSSVNSRDIPENLFRLLKHEVRSGNHEKNM